MKRKLAIGIGIAAMIGAALWMRELASWRPVLVGKVNHRVERLLFSGNGHYLFAAGRNSGLMIDVTRDAGDGSLMGISDFKGTFGASTFPSVGTDGRNWRFIFSNANAKLVPLRGLFVKSPQHPWKDFSDGDNGVSISGTGIMKRPNGDLRFGWSLARREVYGELNGEILVWNADNGKMKKRVRYAKSTPQDAVFSPDGSLLMTQENKVVNSTPMSYLRLYSVLNGKLIPSPNFGEYQMTANDFWDFGFSPDSQVVWATSPDLYAIRIENGAIVFSADATGPVKWLPDGRVGIVTQNGFEWRDIKGNLLERLPGPFQRPLRQNAPESLIDWLESPDGNWIYSAEQSGIIRRWRAK